MNVFILCTGRSGSTTFMNACTHLTNFTSGHETRASKIGEERLNYPENHIECDNRLSWFLGGLDKKYGDDAFYVHLKRNRAKTVASENQRWYVRGSVIRPFCQGILMRPVPNMDAEQRHKITETYHDTVTENIEHFLKDKTQKMTVYLENLSEVFPEFWERVNAEGSLERALQELEVRHNKNVWERLQKKHGNKLKPFIHIWRRLKLLAWV